jgi:hypothetical protein
LNIAQQLGSVYFSFPELNYLLNNLFRFPIFADIPIDSGFGNAIVCLGLLSAIAFLGLGDHPCKIKINSASLNQHQI